MTHKFIADQYGATLTSTTLPSVNKQQLDAYDGAHAFKVSCQSGDVNATAGIDFRIADNMPINCKDFDFDESTITASSLDSLRSGMTGTWEGCVKTPWVPAYRITMRINADGTYSAVSDEVLDGVQMNAMYYGAEEDSPEKRYSITDFQDNGTGVGNVDIVFWPGNINTGTLDNIKLMGNQLSFDFYHQNSYGPLTFQLYRK